MCYWCCKPGGCCVGGGGAVTNGAPATRCEAGGTTPIAGPRCPPPNLGPSSLFSSSRLFRQAALGFKFLSRREKTTEYINYLVQAQKLPHRTGCNCLPLTCCSKDIITSTAMLSMPNFVCGLSVFK